eukprot:COSAG03_NODE_13506_length_500_cov_1.269327_2_plen_111_part_00
MALVGVLVASALTRGTAAQEPSADAQALAACAAMNMTAKLGMMRGYGTVKAYDGYSRNSGCGGVCGRPASTNAAGDVTAGLSLSHSLSLSLSLSLWTNAAARGCRDLPLG